MQPKALITGVTGQDGSYLAEILLGKGYEVHGVVRRTSMFNRARIEHFFSQNYEGKNHFFLHYGDMGDSSSLARIALEVQPDEVYHLAAQSHVGISFEVPEYTADVTGVGTVRLLEALRSAANNAKFYQASSSELFGGVHNNIQTEDTPFYPRSPYACAKAYAFFITRNYREAYDMFAVNGILFNHESPRRGESFVTRKITLSLARILAGKQDVLRLGNLEAKRDWGYAKEYVEGMWMMLQHSKPGDYVLATGRTETVRSFLELCLQIANISFERQGEGVDEVYINTKTGKPVVQIDPHYFRPTEVDVLIGDPTKAKQEIGWEPKTTLEQLARIMMKSDCKEHGIAI